jgi:L-threonylcarbamoyladenylate synthase
LARLRLNAAAPEAGEKMIGFGAVQGDWTLSEAGDLIEAAARLFHLLRLADDAAGSKGNIAIAAIPETGLGRAINDRLRRAAAPRP